MNAELRASMQQLKGARDEYLRDKKANRGLGAQSDKVLRSFQIVLELFLSCPAEEASWDIVRELEQIKEQCDLTRVALEHDKLTNLYWAMAYL